MDDALVLETATSRAVFSLDGARILSLQFDGRELLRTSDPREDVWFGGFVMAPWAGLLRHATLRFDETDYTLPVNWDGHSLHGVGRFARFRVIGGELVAPLPQEWPLGGHLAVVPQLAPDSLRVMFTVTAGAHAMPVALGWHPWFARSGAAGAASVRLPSGATKLERGQDGLATGEWVSPGEGPWDDCFTTDGAVEVDWPGAGTLTVSSDGGYVGVFDGEESGIAVEPMTAPVETLPTVLQPGESLSLHVTLTWTRS